MKATDLVKSLSLSSITSEDFKVVTLYKGQNPDVFLVDNVGDGTCEFRCSVEYEAYMLMVGDVEGNDVCNAIDAAWNWFHTGFVNNFISKDPETNLLHLNW